ncbi:Type 1 glutamine amidotransferase-like domain-containing protein [Bacillus licheniformis]
MGKWFLSGGGDAHQTEQLDRHFARSICPHKPLLYIPIAMDADRYDDGFDWISRLFHPLGIKNIVMWTDVKGKTVHDLDVFSAVYIGGGNTFRLLKQFMNRILPRF